MAKKVRFPLKMKGTDVRTIEELREHFDLESVLGYFANGKLAIWLRDRYYDNEAMAVETLSSDDNKLSMKLCGILQVPYTGEKADIDIETVRRRQEKIALLRQFSNDESLVAKVDAIAFNQEDLLDILDTGIEKMVYLCKGEFDIPLTAKNITYVGLDRPTVTLRAYDNVDFNSLNLKFIDISYSWNNSNITSADELYQAESLFELGKIDEVKEIFKNISATQNPRVSNLKAYIYFNNRESKIKKAEELFAVYDTEKLLPLLEELIDEGFAKAKYILALLYETGYDRVKFSRDDEKRECLLKDAYSDGYLPAFFRYQVGLYCTKDNAKDAATQDGMSMIEVFSKMKELADEGDSFAANEYARMCTNKIFLGIGGNDYESAMIYFNLSPLIFKYYGIAHMYQDGLGIEKEPYIACDYYKKSAECGYNPAEYKLAMCYYEPYFGKFETDSAKQCVKWLNLAYEHGNMAAIGTLAFCYNNGYGIAQDCSKGIRFSKEGAKIGNLTAIGNLAWCYEHGKGTSMDIDLAKKWYRIGADKGDSYCKKACERLRC